MISIVLIASLQVASQDWASMSAKILNTPSSGEKNVESAFCAWKGENVVWRTKEIEVSIIDGVLRMADLARKRGVSARVDKLPPTSKLLFQMYISGVVPTWPTYFGPSLDESTLGAFCALAQGKAGANYEEELVKAPNGAVMARQFSYDSAMGRASWIASIATPPHSLFFSLEESGGNDATYAFDGEVTTVDKPSLSQGIVYSELKSIVPLKPGKSLGSFKSQSELTDWVLGLSRFQKALFLK